MKKLQSSQSFTVTTVRDGVSVTCTPGSLIVPCTEGGVVDGTLAKTLALSWTLKAGSTVLTVSSVTLKSKSTYISVTKNSNTSFAVSIPSGLPRTELDKGIVFAVASGSYSADFFFALIASCKGEKGDDGDPGDDGRDAATLVFEPAVAVFRADSNGNVPSGQTFISSVLLQLSDGTTATPTLSGLVAATDAVCSYSGNRITVSVDEDGYTDSDIEGYCAVRGTATIGGVAYVARGSLKITSVRQGADGPRGKTGPMTYLAGDYDPTVNYGSLLTDTRCPVVHYVDGTTDQYWYPTASYKGAGYAPSTANGWAQAERLEMVVTKVLFTQFAKMGGFVVSGDYMLSQYGELIDADGNRLALTEQTDSDGSTHWRYNGVDAYTYFRDYDPMVERYRDMTPSTYLQYYNRGMDYPLLVRNNWQYWASYESTSDAFYITLNSGDAHINDLKSLSIGGHYFLCGTDTNGVFHCLLMRKSQAVGTNNRLYGYREKIMSHLSQTMFRPVKVVNAATGEEWLAGGKVHVGADGGVTVEGTIRAKNLYRNLCLFSNGVYSTEVYYISSLNDWSRAKGYAVGDYIIGRPDANAEPDFSSVGMVLCSYDADIIQMVPTSNNSWDSSNPLRLPAPKDFPGKVVEITGWSRTTSEVNMYVGSVMGSVSSMCLAVEVSGGKFVPAETATVIAIKTGTTTRFMSMMLNGNYYWTKLNEK